MTFAQLEQVAANLKHNRFLPQVFADRTAATAWLVDQISPGQSVSFGGSVTLEQIGLAAQLRAKSAQIELLTDEDCPAEITAKRAFLRRTICADNFFCSANAITQEGWIYNVDGTGNRVAAMSFGPEKIFIVAGSNKLVADLAAAQQRLETIAAPQNARQLGRKTPCFAQGSCTDCNSPERMCNIYTVLRRPSRLTPTYVILIDEELGY